MSGIHNDIIEDMVSTMTVGTVTNMAAMAMDRIVYSDSNAYISGEAVDKATERYLLDNIETVLKPFAQYGNNDSLETIAETVGITPMSSFNAVKNAIKAVNEICDRAYSVKDLAVAWLNDNRWHDAKASYQERYEAGKRGASVRRWKELCEVLDIAEAEEIVRACKGRTIGSPYYIRPSERVKQIFDLLGYTAFGHDGQWWYEAEATIKIAEDLELTDKVTPKKFRYIVGRRLSRNGFTVAEIEMVLRTDIDTFKTGWRQYGCWRIARHLKSIGAKVPEYLNQLGHQDSIYSDDLLRKMSFLSTMDLSNITSLSDNAAEWPTMKLLVALLGVEKAIKFINNLDDIPKAECKRLFNSGVYDIHDWEWKKAHNDIAIPHTFDSWTLVEWLLRKMKESPEALQKKRVAYGPNGQAREFTLLQVLDELRGEDLVNGIKTKPDTAFEHAARRREEEAQREIEDDKTRYPAAPWRDNDNVHQLRCAIHLKMEGKLMDNCVAGYHRACKAGRTYIYHVNVGDHMHATMEIDHNGTVFQLYEAGNKIACNALFAAVKNWGRMNHIALDFSQCNHRH